MRNHRSRRFRVLVHLDAQYEAARKILHGILHFASMNTHWEVQFTDREFPYGNLSFYSEWKPDAIIIDSRCRTTDRKAFLSMDAKVAVFVNTEPPKEWRRSFAILEPDNGQIGRTAAAFLLRKRLAGFAYIGDVDARDWDKARECAFCAALRAAGATASRFAPSPENSWTAHEKMISGWLKSLPKPCGIFASHDIRGKHVLDTCRRMGLSIPEQIQVLGVDDEAYICEQTVPSLSSISPSYEDGGLAAARFIDAILNGNADKGDGSLTKRITFGVKGIVERMSTTDTYGIAQRVASARKFVQKHASTGIGAADVAASVGVSLRVLQRNFKTVTGSTILDAIQEVRLLRAKELLHKTNVPVKNLAALCGFRSASHLKRLFKSRFGITMSEWRG